MRTSTRFFCSATAGLAALLLASSILAAEPPPPIVPAPTSMTMGAGRATLTPGSTVRYSDPSAAGVAELLSDDLDHVYSLAPAVASGSSPGPGDIQLDLITDPSLDEEGYRMSVTDHVLIEATGIDGLFAGAVSVLQAATPDGADLDLPWMTIEDEPFRSLRALSMDIKNHWHSLSEIEKFVNLCRFYKVRHLTLHTGAPQWIGSVMDSTAGISAASRQSDRLYTRAEMDGLVAYAAARGVYLVPRNMINEGTSVMRHAMQDDYNTSDAYPNWVQEAYADEGVDFSPGNPEGLDGYVDTDGNGVDDTDPDYWKAMDIFKKRSYAQFAAGYADGKLPYYHVGAVLGEGGTHPDNVKKTLDILRTVDADVKVQFWNGINAGSPGDLAGHQDDTIVCYYQQWGGSDINGLIDNGWPILNSAWSPLYIVGSGLARTQQQVHDDWNTFRTGHDGFVGGQTVYEAINWTEFDTPAGQSLTTGGMLCTWEISASVHLDRVRIRLPAFSEHAWHHKSWPYPAGDYADFRARYLSVDALVPAFLGLTLSAPATPAGLGATNGDLANAIQISWRGSVGFPDGYRVLRNDINNVGSATRIAEVEIDEFYTDTNVTVNTPYYYWVKAFNAVGESSLAGSVLGSAGDGIAQTEAHEPFDYPAGESINGKDGGEGWASGGWSLTSANGTIETVAPSLSYSTLPTSGGALRIHPVENTPAVNISRDLAEEMGAGGTTLWLSFLFRGDPRASGHAFIRFTDAPGIGKNWGNQFALENSTSGITMNSGQTYFVVVRFDFGAADNLYMWIDPDLASEPGVGTEDHSAAADVSVDDRFLINIQGYGQGDYTIDEIRLGPTWEYAMGAGSSSDTNDFTAPAPDPMTWNSPPEATGTSAIEMLAATATDSNGVQYLFEELTGHPGGNDSNWQSSPYYVDTGLQPETMYTYRVRARDKSPQQNTNDWSDAHSATTEAAVIIGSNAALKVHFELEDSGGARLDPVVDSTGNIGTAVFENSFSSGDLQQTWDHSDPYGYCMFFGGNWKRIQMGGVAGTPDDTDTVIDPVTTDFSLSIWAKPNTLAQPWHLFASNNSGGAIGAYHGYALLVDALGRVIFDTGLGGGGYQYMTTTGLVPAGSWAHIALTFRDNGGGSTHTARIYVDGLLASEETGTAAPAQPTATAWNLGASGPGLYRATGHMDDFRFYHGILTPIDVSALALLGPDADGNNLPDAWEYQYFGVVGIDPDGQSDSDLLTNGDEFAAGTVPTNGASTLRVDLDEGPGLVARVPTVIASGAGYDGLDRYYSLEICTNLLDGDVGWGDVPGYASLPATGGNIVYTNSGDGSQTHVRASTWLE